MKKKLTVILAAMAAIACLGGCGGKTQQAAGIGTSAEEQTQTQPQEQAQQNSGRAILVVSFGTSYNDSRDITIGAVESAIAEAYPEYEVRRAFTSQIIIDKLKERDGLIIDNVEEALERAAADGVKELIVQPTHLMDGYEYHDLADALADAADRFDRVALAEPLLTDDSDFEAVMRAVTERTASYDDGSTAICFMGHGTEADSNGVYAKLGEMFRDNGYDNYYIGTVEARPDLDDVIAAMSGKGYAKVVLEPLMVVAGDHANNDMAGDEDSWKTALEAEGYEVECILEGLGQIPAIRDIYVEHVGEAIASKDAIAAPGDERAQASRDALRDGIYAVEVESDSSMFRVTDARLTVAGGEMNALITLSGQGYEKLYMGTSGEAGEASEEDFIFFEEDADGAYTYRVPVAALDEPLDCAAFSFKKQEWYDRKLTFLSGSVQEAEGDYAMEILFEGGSGKAQILSPATVRMEDGRMIAVLQWNSPNYDYMIVDGEKYLPVNTEGDSAFEIPIAALGTEIAVTGDTVAMSRPHEVEYTVRFLPDTLRAAQ